jgi:hypothetical protein
VLTGPTDLRFNPATGVKIRPVANLILRDSVHQDLGFPEACQNGDLFPNGQFALNRQSISTDCALKGHDLSDAVACSRLCWREHLCRLCLNL